jgi:hypothetical protein
LLKRNERRVGKMEREKTSFGICGKNDFGLRHRAEDRKVKKVHTPTKNSFQLKENGKTN